jgi:methionine-rich copper-binding protein CopC
MRRRQSLTALLAGLALLALPAVAAAHSDIVSSDPQASANLDDPPTEVVVTYDGELNPTSSFTVTDRHDVVVGTGELDLDVAERNVLRGAVEIFEPGVYMVGWTAVSVDGHEETGSFAFGYQADPGAEVDGDEGTPDTALPALAGPSWPALAGLALVAAAAGLALRRGILTPATRRA